MCCLTHHERHQIRPPVKRPPGALGSKRTALAAVLLSSWLHRTTPNTPKRAPQPPPLLFPEREITFHRSRSSQIRSVLPFKMEPQPADRRVGMSDPRPWKRGKGGLRQLMFVSAAGRPRSPCPRMYYSPASCAGISGLERLLACSTDFSDPTGVLSHLSPTPK